MPRRKTAAAVDHPPPTIESHNRGRFAHLYGVLTAQEMADHLKCSPEAVYERAVAGEFIFPLQPGSMTGATPPFNSMSAWTSRR